MTSASRMTAALFALAAAGALLTARGGFSETAATRVAPDSDARVGLISEGEEVDLGEYAATRGRTVFFFKKPWCGACWRAAPRVEEAVRDSGDATLRVIDIGTWGSPVARAHGIRALPFAVLFEDGRPAVSGVEAVLARLAEAAAR